MQFVWTPSKNLVSVKEEKKYQLAFDGHTARMTLKSRLRSPKRATPEKFKLDARHVKSANQETVKA